MTLDIKKIKKLLKLLEQTPFHEIELEEEGFRIKVKKAPPEPNIQFPFHGSIPSSATLPQIQPVPSKKLPKPHEKLESEIELTEGRAIIHSPLVGTFYISPSPNAPPFVNEGDIIKPGQILCIIEAMKLMNEVECDRSGKIAAILVKNAQPVEYGEPLFIIETEGF